MFADVILLESDIQDALLARLQLRRVPGMRCRVRHVSRLTDLSRAIEFCGPAVIVTDLLFPEVWGSLAVARVQAVAPWVPIIVMTAFDPPGLDAELERLDITARLDKSGAGYAALPHAVARAARAGHMGHARVRPWPMSA